MLDAPRPWIFYDVSVSGVTFLRIRGIAVEAHWSWLVIVVLVYQSLVYVFFPNAYPGLSAGTYAAMGLVTIVFYFGSILLHELGHGLQSIHEGMGIEKITMWALGGLAWIGSGFRSAGAEFRVTVAGPAVTVVLALVFGGVAWAGRELGWGEPITGTAAYLNRFNLIVLAFNLLPAFPLDGGRILRSALWHLRGDFGRATKWAARVGAAFGVAFMALGAVLVFVPPTMRPRIPFVGGFFSGLWYLAIGYFLLYGARVSLASASRWQQPAGADHVGHLLAPAPVILSPETTVAQFFDEINRARGYSTSPYPVMKNGRLLGVVSLGLASTVSPEARMGSTIADVMVSTEDAVVLRRETPMQEALTALQEGSGRGVVLENGDQVAGVVLVSDVARALGEMEEARRSSPHRV